MSNVMIVNLSDKDLKVMNVLYKYRGMELNQILSSTGYGTGGRYNMYRTIRRLRDKGMIRGVRLKDVMSKEDLKARNDGEMYFLTAKGYSYMLSSLGVPIGHSGTGYGGDYGDFDYALAKPPTRFVSHHLVVVDALLAARRFQKNVDGENPLRHSFDFRDNRYASRRFSVVIEDEGSNPYTKKMNLRPDAEVLIHSKTYFIEVDLDTERAEKIKSKFEGYKAYFDYLSGNGEPLPEGIIFVSEKLEFFNAKERRWLTIAGVFLDVLGEYACRVNLMYESVDMLHEVFAREYNFKIRSNNYLMLLEKSRNVESYNGTKISYGGFGWVELHYSISQFTSSNVLFLYARVDGFETKGWSLLQKFKEYVDDESTRPPNFNHITRFIPVMWYTDNPPKSPFAPREIQNSDYFSQKLHLQINGQNAIWEDSFGTEIANPLLENDNPGC